MVDGGIVVAICQYGGEFTSGPNGNLIYKGGEAHAVDVTRDMPLESFKDEVSKVFHVDVTDMSLKYFLPNNNRTLITISCDRDLQRMVDFTINAAQVDVFLISRVENRFIFVPFCLLCFWKSQCHVYVYVTHFCRTHDRYRID
jgi:zinc finger SWIM domain-containing protein 3